MIQKLAQVAKAKETKQLRAQKKAAEKESKRQKHQAYKEQQRQKKQQDEQQSHVAAFENALQNHRPGAASKGKEVLEEGTDTRSQAVGAARTKGRGDKVVQESLLCACESGKLFSECHKPLLQEKGAGTRSKRLKASRTEGLPDKKHKETDAELLQLEIAYEREVQTLALAQENAKVAQKRQARTTNRKKQRLLNKQWRIEQLQQRVQALENAESTQVKSKEQRKPGHIETFDDVRV